MIGVNHRCTLVLMGLFQEALAWASAEHGINPNFSDPKQHQVRCCDCDCFSIKAFCSF